MTRIAPQKPWKRSQYCLRLIPMVHRGFERLLSSIDPVIVVEAWLLPLGQPDRGFVLVSDCLIDIRQKEIWGRTNKYFQHSCQIGGGEMGLNLSIGSIGALPSKESRPCSSGVVVVVLHFDDNCFCRPPLSKHGGLTALYLLPLSHGLPELT